MSPSKTPRKVKENNGIGKTKTRVVRSKYDEQLGFHGLGRPGAAGGHPELSRLDKMLFWVLRWDNGRPKQVAQSISWHWAIKC